MANSGSSLGEPSPSDDPFESISLDESFIQGAQHTELTAAQRERARRQANLQRLLADEDAQVANQQHEYRRFAPGDGTTAGPEQRRSWLPWRRRSSSGARGSSGTRRRGKFGLVRSPLLIAGLVVLAGVFALDYFTQNDVNSASKSALDPLGRTAARPSDWPPEAERPKEPLGTPRPVPAGGGSHKFLQFQPQGVTPVSYDPCRPIHYVTRPGGPPEGRILIREAVAAVSGATGLVFVDDGVTDEGPSDKRPPYQRERYGERWAPVLITWSDPVESPLLGEVSPESPLSDVAGFAGSQAVGFGDDAAQLVYVTGAVTLDGPDLTAMLLQPGGADQVRAVIQHELGHLVGLNHVDDSTQIMNHQGTAGIDSYQAGDLEGLATLGSGQCFPDI